jgi:hypothetical protein
VRSGRKRLEVGGDGAGSGPERSAAERRREEAAAVTADWAVPAREKEAGEEGDAPALGWASVEKRRGKGGKRAWEGVGPASRLRGREGEIKISLFLFLKHFSKFIFK